MDSALRAICPATDPGELLKIVEDSAAVQAQGT
jgi:hypothetical protein